MIKLKINGATRQFDGDPDMPLLWYLRDIVGLTGSKFGCGMGLCGACTVHQDGVAIRSCVTPVRAVAGREITTIEGLPVAGTILCKRPGRPSMSRNAAIVRWGRSCKPPRC